MSEKTYTSNIPGSPDTDVKFVLRRSSMTTSFTDDEYKLCMNKMINGHSVAVQYSSSGLCEAQLIKIDLGGELIFSRCGDGLLVTYTVSSNAEDHAVTINTYSYS